MPTLWPLLKSGIVLAADIAALSASRHIAAAENRALSAQGRQAAAKPTPIVNEVTMSLADAADTQGVSTRRILKQHPNDDAAAHIDQTVFHDGNRDTSTLYPLNGPVTNK